MPGQQWAANHAGHVPQAQINQMPPTQGTDQVLLMELQKRRSADPAVIQHAAAAFSLLHMVEQMLAYPQAAPTAPAIPAKAAAPAPQQSQKINQQGVEQPRGEQTALAINGSAEDLLRDVQKKNSDLRSLLTNQVRSSQPSV